MYQRLLNDIPNSDPCGGPLPMTLADVQDRVTKILETLIGKSLVTAHQRRNLFDLGLDSVACVQLRNRLSTAFGIHLSPQFIYQNFSLARLSHVLHSRVALREDVSQPPFESALTREDMIHAILERQLTSLQITADLILSSRSLARKMQTNAAHVVAVTGATGSLGIWQVKALLDRVDVRQVVCLVRGAGIADSYDKLLLGFQKVRLDGLTHQIQEWKNGQLSRPGVPAVSLNQRLVVVPFDLSSAHFAECEYLALASNLTTIVHSGWKMDFNQNVQDFDCCLSGLSILVVGMLTFSYYSRKALPNS